MEERFTVRRIRPEEGPVLRAIRLRSLETDPLSFGSELAREAEYPDARWAEQARTNATGNERAIYFAEVGPTTVIGLVGAFPEAANRHLWAMWVEPSHRGRGIGAALLDSILRWCENAAPGAAVRLDVNPTRVPAVRLYERSGFRRTGVNRPLGHHAPAEVEEMGRPAGSS